MTLSRRILHSSSLWKKGQKRGWNITDHQDYQTGSGNVVWKALGSSFTPSEMVKISPITFLFLLLKNMECEEDKKKKKSTQEKQQGWQIIYGHWGSNYDILTEFLFFSIFKIFNFYLFDCTGSQLQHTVFLVRASKLLVVACGI